MDLSSQRFGAVFAIAIASSVFSAFGHLGTPASVTDVFKPAVAVSAALALLGTITAPAIAPRHKPVGDLELAEAPVASG